MHCISLPSSIVPGNAWTLGVIEESIDQLTQQENERITAEVSSQILFHTMVLSSLM